MSCISGQWKCHFSECAIVAEGRSRSGLDTNCSACLHVKEAQKQQSISEQGMPHYNLCNTVLSSGPFPPAVRAEFEAHMINGCTTLIQRVSSKSFVVATSPTSESPLGLLHVHISSANSFQCTCNKYRRSTNLASTTTAPKLSKRCIHFCFCGLLCQMNPSGKNFLSVKMVIGHDHHKTYSFVTCNN